MYLQLYRAAVACARLVCLGASGDGHDRGPPMVRDAKRPDGLPEDELGPKHVREYAIRLKIGSGQSLE